ncbi:ATP-dependent DNA helicase MER3 [Marasmius tenuissimus]|nr:ATP-dependent DNA helicase MER3 [Marasmius tenuissimus]
MEYWSDQQAEYYDDGGYMGQDMPEYQGDDQTYGGEHYSDEIMNSSPSPAERGTVMSRYSQRYEPLDDIEEYPEDYGQPQPQAFPSHSTFRYGHMPSQNQASFHSLAPRTRFPFHTQQTQFSRAFHNMPGPQQRNAPPPPLPQPSRHQAGPALFDPAVSQSRVEERTQNSRPEASTSGPQVVGQKIKLRPVSELPDMYRAMFKFGVFNAVQSSCFDDLLHTPENLVRRLPAIFGSALMKKKKIIGSPTGSGKTVLFELAIIKMLTEAGPGSRAKCVYIAPTKALCGERYRDWSNKFDALGFKCESTTPKFGIPHSNDYNDIGCELTGDTVHFGRGVWGEAKNASIIVTTGEKWDSLTRNWSDYSNILSTIQLFLVDEVHILNESRGSTLEVVVSRMKIRGSGVRFVVVSATVPNIQDIAAWIGSSGGKGVAKVFEFGEDYRPCKLTRHVIGVPRQKGSNDFVFARTLDFKLYNVLQTYSEGKPILVFVSTRKGVFGTAEQLQKEFKAAEEKRQKTPWTKPVRIDHTFSDKRLGELAAYGIGVHHAGLTLDDRRAMEELYLKKVLRIMVATSTLAVGVNLPAHTVVIRGVHTFQNNAMVEYSDLDVMQMLGRAGRPQFDKEGVAIIICEVELEHKYRSLVQGKSIVESSLQNNLAEHLNSEIGLGTITNVTSAKEWLKQSFLYQRIQKNPAHYSMNKDANQSWEEKMDGIVTEGVDSLRKSQLIDEADDDDETLQSTEFGDIMSKFYIRQATMCSILALPETVNLRGVLEMISTSEELAESKLRGSERSVYNKLRKHNDVRFEVKKMEKTSDKVFVLIQAVLGGIPLNDNEYKTGDSQIHLEAFSVFRHLPRIARAVVEVAIARQRGAQLKYGLELLRCLTAKAWEDRPVALKQLESIGEKSLKILTERGITSLAILRKQDALRLETILNRRPPFGLQLLSAIREFPLYSLKVVEQEVQSDGGKNPVKVILGISCGLAEETPESNASKKKTKPRYTNMTGVLTLTSDHQFVDFRRIATKSLKEEKHFDLEVSLDKPSQSVIVYMVSESYVGVTVTKAYKPEIPSSEYPTRVTKPSTVLDMELDGLEDCPELFSTDDVDCNGEIIVKYEPDPVVVKDLTKPKPSITTAAKLLEKGNGQKSKPTATEYLPEPEQLPNGNYRCNHSCKDKTACRHLCCREGLPKPSKPGKTQASTAHISPQPPPPQPPAKMEPILARPLPKKYNFKSKAATSVKPDRTLEDLEKLHKVTNVEGNLNLPKGHRLKLEPVPSSSGSATKSKKKRLPTPDFDIDFTEIHDEKQDTLKRRMLVELSDDEDELPDADQVFDSLRKGSSKKRKQLSDSFSDPDMDALIRDFPDSTGHDSVINTRRSPQASPIKRIKPTREVYRSTDPLFLPSTSDDVPTNLDSIVNDDDDSEVEIIDSPRFYDYDEPLSVPMGIDDFTLDPRYSQYTDGSSTTPELTMMSSEDDDVSREMDLLVTDDASARRRGTAGGSHAWGTASCAQDDATETVEEKKQQEQEVVDPMEEEFARLEAWLNSSAVEIVPGYRG